MADISQEQHPGPQAQMQLDLEAGRMMACAGGAGAAEVSGWMIRLMTGEYFTGPHVAALVLGVCACIAAVNTIQAGLELNGDQAE